MVHVWVRVRPGRGDIISMKAWPMTLDMRMSLTNPVDTGPHEKDTIVCGDLCGTVFPGSGGFRLGDLPVGLSTYLASSCRKALALISCVSGLERPTEPPIGPSWADLPFTLKVTPLGALDLTSRLAGDCQLVQKNDWNIEHTRVGVVEILVEELLTAY